MKSQFEENDHAIIIGDSAGWGHHHPRGTEVILTAPRTEDGHVIWDACKVGTDVAWYVSEQDLTPVWTPASDEEISEAVASILKAV